MSTPPTIDITQTRKPEIESTLPLINIVFLLLIFFLIAGTFQTPLAEDIDAPHTAVVFEDIDFLPSQWIYADAYGRLSYDRRLLEEDQLSSAFQMGRAVLFADQELRGGDLARVLRSIELAGGERVMLITELQQKQ